MENPFYKEFNTWAELAKIIESLPDDVKNRAVMFGGVRGDDEWEAFSVNEIGTVLDSNLYFDQYDGTPIEPGTLMLYV